VLVKITNSVLYSDWFVHIWIMSNYNTSSPNLQTQKMSSLTALSPPPDPSWDGKCDQTEHSPLPNLCANWNLIPRREHLRRWLEDGKLLPCQKMVVGCGISCTKWQWNEQPPPCPPFELLQWHLQILSKIPPSWHFSVDTPCSYFLGMLNSSAVQRYFSFYFENPTVSQHSFWVIPLSRRKNQCL